MKKCVNCNKITETKQICKDCHKQLCSDCRTKNMLCNTCLCIREDKSKYNFYLIEKYMTNALTLLLILAILVPFVWSQLAILDYKKSCVSVNDDYFIKEAVYETKLVFNSTTGKNDNVTVFKEYKDVMIKRNKELCNETVTINGKSVDFKLQGFNCKNVTGEVICDSCSDGNCDGTCSSNGGETCAKIRDGIVQYKNSVVEWNETSGLVVVPKLEVR